MKVGDLVRWRRDQLGEAVPHRTEKDIGMVYDLDMYGRPIVLWQSEWRGHDHHYYGEFLSQIEVINEDR